MSGEPSVADLWAKVTPDTDPESIEATGSLTDVAQAYRAGRITAAEGKRLQQAVEARTTAYLQSQGYDVE